MFCISIHYHRIIYNSKMKVIIFGWHCFSFNLLLAAATVPRTWDDILQHFIFVCPALALCINKTLRVSPQVSSELLLNLHIDTKPWQIIIPTESVSQIYTASEMLPENGNVITRKFTYFMWQDNIYLFLVHFHCKWKHFWQDVNMTDCGDPIRR